MLQRATIARILGVVARVAAAVVGRMLAREGMRAVLEPPPDAIPLAASPAPSPLEAAVQQTARQLQPSLPQRLDEITTLVTVRAEGRTLIYEHQLGGARPMNQKLAAQTLRERVCRSSMRGSVERSVTFHYDYRSPPPNLQLLASIPVSDCP